MIGAALLTAGVIYVSKLICIDGIFGSQSHFDYISNQNAWSDSRKLSILNHFLEINGFPRVDSIDAGMDCLRDNDLTNTFEAYTEGLANYEDYLREEDGE